MRWGSNFLRTSKRCSNTFGRGETPTLSWLPAPARLFLSGRRCRRSERNRRRDDRRLTEGPRSSEPPRGTSSAHGGCHQRQAQLQVQLGATSSKAQSITQIASAYKATQTVNKHPFLTQGWTTKSSPTVLPRLPQALSSRLLDTKAAPHNEYPCRVAL